MLKDLLFTITSDTEFNDRAMRIFHFQHQHNKVYREFCHYLKIDPEKINHPEEIPFLPIQFFKSHKVVSSTEKPEQIFRSSGTTGQIASKHFVSDISLYEKSFTTGFEQFYRPAEEYVVLALLPSYLEREGSSLIYMVNAFIERSRHLESGFYLHNLSALAETLQELDFQGKKTLLIGVSFALLELVEKFQFHLKNTIVMETGGMKGRRKEMLRSELHEILSKGFGVEKIHSEYGMTELLSQAYSKGKGIFACPPHMKILIRDPEDPFQLLPDGRTGGINVIDLANLNSCAFIATQDLGKIIDGNTFEVLGRFDNSDLRGCNLLVL